MDVLVPDPWQGQPLARERSRETEHRESEQGQEDDQAQDEPEYQPQEGYPAEADVEEQEQQPAEGLQGTQHESLLRVEENEAASAVQKIGNESEQGDIG